MSAPNDDDDVWVIDLDGVIWLGDKPIPGAAEAVAHLQERGKTVVFATNNSSLTQEGNVAKLARHSIDARGAVVSSAMASATLVEPGETVLVCAGEGVHQAMSARGVNIVADGPADATLPGAEVLKPGCGSLVAAVATAGGVEPMFAGKPHQPLATYIHENFGRSGLVVGDRVDTDGAFAKTLGFRFTLVLSGVITEADLPVEPSPDLIAPDLAMAVEDALNRSLEWDTRQACRR